jgi:hypothetical protein
VIEVLGDLPVTVVVDLTRTEARSVAAVLAKAGIAGLSGRRPCRVDRATRVTNSRRVPDPLGFV